MLKRKPWLIGLLILGLMLLMMARSAPQSPPIQAVTVHDIRELAALLTLEVPLQTLVEHRLVGYSGYIQCLVLAQGRAMIGTDLDAASLKVDQPLRKLTLVLAQPQVISAELDHDRTRVLFIHRRGMWQLMPGEAGEAALLQQSLRQAQHRLHSLADTSRHRQLAREQTRRVLEQFADQAGYQIELQWH